MANRKEREKRRASRLRKSQKAMIHKDQAEELLESEDFEEPEVVIDEDGELAEEEEIQKDYYDSPVMVQPVVGPTSWSELDAQRKAVEKAQAVREVTYSVQDLVSNILYSDMAPDAKATAIGKVGEGFGKRLKSVEAEKSEKSIDEDMDLLELEAMIGRDYRRTGVVEKMSDWIVKKKLTAATESKLSDDDFALVVEREGKKVRKYPIHDKAHVRNALARAAQMIKKGGEAATDAKAALPKIRAAAKKLGIGINKEISSIIIEKDKSEKWRAVMWPSNNFKDLDGEIISEKAHKEYVDWVNKNMEFAPVFQTWHIPGTARTHPVDFVGYENGFLIMSAPLEPHEAAGLLKAQAKTDIGMSHGSLALARNPVQKNVVDLYRMVEVSDLPLEKAANPFTDFETLEKEAHMNQSEYLASILGKEKADAFLERTGLKQKQLREAGVEEKERDANPAPDPALVKKEQPAPAMPDMAAIIQAVRDDIGVDELSEFLAKAQRALEDVEKIPLLESLVKDLSKSQDEALAEKINPPAEKVLVWKQKRASQSDNNVLKGDNAEDAKLKKSTPALPEGYWLSELSGTAPIEQ